MEGGGFRVYNPLGSITPNATHLPPGPVMTSPDGHSPQPPNTLLLLLYLLLLLSTHFFFFFTLVTGPRRSLSLKLSDTRVYEP